MKSFIGLASMVTEITKAPVALIFMGLIKPDLNMEAGSIGSGPAGAGMA